jgi:hypothetical protein
MTNNIVGITYGFEAAPTDNGYSRLGGYTVHLDGNTELIILKGSTVSGIVTANDLRDNTKYQVPSGKKARIIYWHDSATPTATGHGWFYADNQDGETNRVDILFEDSRLDQIEYSISIPALKYINVEDAVVDTYHVIIMEEDA